MAAPGAAIDDISEAISGLKIFPNACSDNFELEFNLTANNHVSGYLFDMNGKIVKDVLSETLTAGNYNKLIDVSNLAAGIYLLKIQIGNNYLAGKSSNNRATRKLARIMNFV